MELHETLSLAVLSFAAQMACLAEPSGCPEFKVEPPSPSNVLVVRAEDFGFSTTNEHNAAAVNAALAEAKRSGASRLVLAPGTYRCFDEQGIVIDKFADFTFDGRGAVLVFCRPPEFRCQPQSELVPEKANVLVRGCERCEVVNFTMDWDWKRDPLGAFVRVRAKCVDEKSPEDSHVDLEFVDFARYPKYPESVPVQKLAPMDECRTRLRPGKAFSFGQTEGHFGAKNEWIAPNVLRLWPGMAMEGRCQNPATGFSSSGAANLRRVKAMESGGLYRLLHCYYGKNGINLVGNRHLVVRNVSVWSCFGMAMVVDGPQKFWHVDRFRVAPPSEAEFAAAYPDEPFYHRPVSSTSDGHHVARSSGMCRYTDCLWSLNNDDAFNVHDRFTIAIKVAPRRLQIVNRRGASYFRAERGTTLELRNPDFSPTGFAARLSDAVGEYGVRDVLVVDRDLPDQGGSCFLVWDRAYGSDGVHLKGCVFEDSGYRNLFCVSDVTIEGCTFRRTGGAPVRFIADYRQSHWCEGRGSRNIVVRDCVFEDCAVVDADAPQVSAVCQTPAGWEVGEIEPGFVGGDVLLEGNRFVRPKGKVFDFGTSPDVVLRNNVVEDGGVVWVEAEDFSEKGGWIVDTQFTHTMGSAYLMCPGPGRQTGNRAATVVAIPSAGEWTAWVRTKDWLPEFSPGGFSLVVGGVESPVLGVSKREGWRWEKAGSFSLSAGAVEIALRDLSGAYARCDAVVLARDPAYVPPDGAEALAAERARRTGAGLDVADGGMFDVVVVGAGPGGMGASLAAARHGAQVALVFDRPVPGGNASSEYGIGFDGASLGKKDSRESGLVEELRLTKVYRRGTYTDAFLEMAAGAPGLSLFPNERVMRVEMDGGRIAAVLSRNTVTGRWTRRRGRYFVDSTGDGWLARFAGARTMYGREAGSEYGEEWIAPDRADALTMSGKLKWRGGRDVGRSVEYVTPAWASVMPEGFDRKVDGPAAPWWLEAPGRFDDIEDPEKARDHLIRICFGFWGWLKNEWKGRASVSSFEMEIPSGFNGRREGWRVVGDYVLTANDCREGRMFDDRVSFGGWSLDTHDPLGMDNPHGDGWWHPHSSVPVYSVPYRALYSADVPNLFMGSRCESMTHIALGSMRVQGTTMAVGQAVGTAAALCLEFGKDARSLGRERIGDLQQALLKDDHYIPCLANADALDLARTARAQATSAVSSSGPEAVADGTARPVGDMYHGWISDPAAALPQTISLALERPARVGEVRLAFDSDLTPMRVKQRMPSRLVKSYDVELLCGGEWRRVAEERENFLRHRVHSFAPCESAAVRVRVNETWGDASARVFEIRIYEPSRPDPWRKLDGRPGISRE